MRTLLLSLFIPIGLFAGPYSSVDPLQDKNGKYYFYDSKNKKRVTKSIYDKAGFFTVQGLARVVVGKKSGYINESGKLVVPLWNYVGYLNAHDKAIKLVIKDKNGKEKAGLFGKNGTVVKPICDGIYYFYGDYAKVKKDGKYGMIHISGKVVVPIIHDWLSQASKEGLIVFMKKKGKEFQGYGCLNAENKVVIKPTYSYIGPFRAGLSRVSIKEDDLYGYMNAKGEMVIPMKYEQARDYHADGYAQVWTKDDDSQNGQWIGVDGKPYKFKK